MASSILTSISTPTIYPATRVQKFFETYGLVVETQSFNTSSLGTLYYSPYRHLPQHQWRHLRRRRANLGLEFAFPVESALCLMFSGLDIFANHPTPHNVTEKHIRTYAPPTLHLLNIYYALS
jgi:hypothetical protein